MVSVMKEAELEAEAFLMLIEVLIEMLIGVYPPRQEFCIFLQLYFLCISITSKCQRQM